MSTYVLGGRAGWRAQTTAAIDVEAVLRSNGAGTYVSNAFDSAIAGCRWDRVRCEAELPAGTSVAFSSYAADADRGAAAIAALDESEWSPWATVAGTFHGRTASLLSAPAGRYLWLRIALNGTPAARAELRSLDIDFPRNTSLRMLPAVFSTDAGGRDLNERFLAMFDALRDGVLREIRTLGAVIDPRTTRATARRDFLDWLGGWFDMEIVRAWPVARRRAVIAHAGELFRLRGTARGIKRFIALALGRDVEIVENFVDRHWWFAAQQRLGCAVLYGPELAARTVLDGSGTLGATKLASNPAPVTDPFALRANRMTVLVPDREQLDASALAMVRTVVASQKPAHVAADVVAVRAAGRLGVASRLGLDAVVGALRPPAILAGTAPPRLGVNATLGDRP
jgi:phage tail-like protein